VKYPAIVIIPWPSLSALGLQSPIRPNSRCPPCGTPPIASLQKGTIPSRPRRLRIPQISRANRDRCPAGVARIIETASGTLIVPPESPFMLITAFIHWPRVSAATDGLYWRVGLPSPARLSVFAQRTLQTRHVQMRFWGALSSSWPFTCPTSTLRFLPHKAQMRSPGGGQRSARYRSARSVTSTASLRQFCPHRRAVVSPRRRPRHRRIRLHLHP
jgi:hypothetical protein